MANRTWYVIYSSDLISKIKWYLFRKLFPDWASDYIRLRKEEADRLIPHHFNCRCSIPGGILQDDRTDALLYAIHPKAGVQPSEKKKFQSEIHFPIGFGIDNCDLNIPAVMPIFANFESSKLLMQASNSIGQILHLWIADKRWMCDFELWDSRYLSMVDLEFELSCIVLRPFKFDETKDKAKIHGFNLSLKV